MHQPRRIFFDLADPGPWVKSLGRGAFVPTRLPMMLGEVFTLSIRMKRVSRALELPVRVLGRRMPRGAKGVLSAGVVISLADPHHPTAKLLMDLVEGDVVDFEARLRERLRVDVTSLFEHEDELVGVLVDLAEEDEPVLIPTTVAAQPGDRLRLTLGSLSLTRPHVVEVEVKGVVLRDGGRALRCRLFDDGGRQAVQQALANHERSAEG